MRLRWRRQRRRKEEMTTERERYLRKIMMEAIKNDRLHSNKLAD